MLGSYRALYLRVLLKAMYTLPGDHWICFSFHSKLHKEHFLIFISHNWCLTYEKIILCKFYILTPPHFAAG